MVTTQKEKQNNEVLYKSGNVNIQEIKTDLISNFDIELSFSDKVLISTLVKLKSTTLIKKTIEKSIIGNDRKRVVSILMFIKKQPYFDEILQFVFKSALTNFNIYDVKLLYLLFKSNLNLTKILIDDYLSHKGFFAINRGLGFRIFQGDYDANTLFDSLFKSQLNKTDLSEITFLLNNLPKEIDVKSFLKKHESLIQNVFLDFSKSLTRYYNLKLLGLYDYFKSYINFDNVLKSALSYQIEKGNLDIILNIVIDFHKEANFKYILLKNKQKIIDLFSRIRNYHNDQSIIELCKIYPEINFIDDIGFLEFKAYLDSGDVARAIKIFNKNINDNKYQAEFKQQFPNLVKYFVVGQYSNSRLKELNFDLFKYIDINDYVRLGYEELKQHQTYARVRFLLKYSNQVSDFSFIIEDKQVFKRFLVEYFTDIPSFKMKEICDELTNFLKSFSGVIDFSDELKTIFKKTLLEFNYNSTIKEYLMFLKNQTLEGIDLTSEINYGIDYKIQHNKIFEGIWIIDNLANGINTDKTILSFKNSIIELFEFDLDYKTEESRLLFNKFSRIIDFKPCIIKHLHKKFERRYFNMHSSDKKDSQKVYNEFVESGFLSHQEFVNLLIELFTKWLSDLSIIQASGIYSSFEDLVSFDQYLKKTFYENISKIIKDPLVFANCNLIIDLLGKKYMDKIIINLNNRNNFHDTFLFIQHLKDKSKEQIELIKNLVLNPLITRNFDLKKFNKHLGSFDLEKYVSENGENPIANESVFYRFCLLCKYDLKMPDNMDPKLKEIINTFIQSPGVNPAFIKGILNGIVDRYNKNEFKLADFINNIVSGKLDVDKSQIIKPFEQEFDFYPINELVFNALGLSKLNALTVRLSQFMGTNLTIKQLLSQLDDCNNSIKNEICESYDQKIKADSNNKNRYKAQMQKQLEFNCLLKMKAGGKISGINIDSFNFDYIPQEYKSKFETTMNILLQDDNFISFVIDTINVLIDNYSKLPSHLELSKFYDLIIQIKEKSSCQYLTKENFKQFIEDFKLQVMVLMLYVGLNNVKRQQISKELTGKINGIIKQKKYHNPNDEKTTLDRYLSGELVLDSQDEQHLENMIKDYGYADIGVTLSAKIVKNSDPTGWVCGDYTDCCMPLLSSKNLQYIMRDDVSYFLVTIKDENGAETIIAQSVLVAGIQKSSNKNLTQDPTSYDVLIIDNIEIANSAIKYRNKIKIAYELLKSHFPDKKIMIGSKYNDDGGLITGDCQIVNINNISAKLGSLNYSDFFDNSGGYDYNNSESIQQGKIKHYGLQIDSFDSSFLKSKLSKQQIDDIRILLEKIGKGEDDMEGGLIFPDNYSVIFGKGSDYSGYIIAADYIRLINNSVDYLTIERLNILDNADKKLILEEYIQQKNVLCNTKIDAIRLDENNIDEGYVSIFKSILGDKFLYSKTNGYYVFIRK